MTDITDEAIRKLWRDAGGSFYGPRVEHANIKESDFLPFMRALLSRLDKAEAGWQPIETAPFETDDLGCRWLTWCLLWVPDEHGGLPVVGGMDADMWLWRVDDRSCGNFEMPPTHWRPLPPPPSES